MRETTIERKLVTEAKKRGGLAAKFVSPGLVGCRTGWSSSPAAILLSWN